MARKNNKYRKKYFKINKSYHTKYKKNNKKTPKKDTQLTFKVIESGCILYTLSSVVVYMLGLISKFGNNVFFQWCGIISDILSLPMSQSDLLIMVFGLHWFMVILGIIFLINKIYKFFKLL